MVSICLNMIQMEPVWGSLLCSQTYPASLSVSPSGVLFARQGLSDSDKWSSSCSSMSPNTVGFSHYQARTKPVPLWMNGSVKLFNKWTIQTINNLNVMLRKLTLKVDADIRSLLFPSSARQSLTLERPSDSLFSHRAAMTEARCVVRLHVDWVLTFGLMRDFRKRRG